MTEPEKPTRATARFVESHEFDGVRARNKRRTRTAIRSAALELFARQGYTATTVEQIANMANVSSRTFFNYFASKEQCVTFPHEDFAEPLTAAFNRRPMSEPCLVSFRLACKEMFTWIEQDETIRRQIIEVARLADEPDLHGADGLFHEEWEETVAALFRGRGMHPGVARLFALVGIGIWKIATQDWASRGAMGSLVDGIEEGFDSLDHAFTELHTNQPHLSLVPSR